MHPVERDEHLRPQPAPLLPGRVVGGHGSRQQAGEDAAGGGMVLVQVLAGGHPHQLLTCEPQRVPGKGRRVGGDHLPREAAQLRFSPAFPTAQVAEGRGLGPQELVGSGGQPLAQRAQPHVRRRTVLIQPTPGQPVLHQPAEHPHRPTRCHPTLAHQHPVQGRHEQEPRQHHRHRGQDPHLRRPPPAGGYQPQDHRHQRQTHGQRQAGHVREHPEQGQDRQPGPLAPRQLQPAAAEQPQGEYGQGHEDVRHQLAGVPGNPGHQRQGGAEYGQGERPGRQPVTAQHEVQDPEDEQRLDQDRPPEGQPAETGQPQEQSVEQGPARDQAPLEHAAHVAAGVEKDQGKAVPQGRRQQGEATDGKGGQPGRTPEPPRCHRGATHDSPSTAGRTCPPPLVS